MAVDHKGGIRVVIRNHQGLVMAALSENAQHVYNSFTVEAVAALRALEFAIEMGFRRIILEGDSLTAIKKL
ncbi:hypothetical protein REPUB_Repub10bG0047200 [Reevesia pubescens]